MQTNSLNSIPNGRSNARLKDDLIAGLNQIPESWIVTPVTGDKRPYRKDWQNEAPLNRDAIAKDYQTGKAKGCGIRLGEISGGIVAIDLDGLSARQKQQELSGGEKLPRTVSFTSGKIGRSQHLYKVPEQYWGEIQTRKYKSKEGEFVEFRWTGSQSVLPPSAHPETEGYSWIAGCSPSEIEVAEAPMWMIEAMRDRATPELKIVPAPNNSRDDLLDFRDVAHQLPYWDESGRKGWGTFQCPVHTRDGKPHSTDSIHVNLSTGKYEAQCGCDLKEIYRAATELVGHSKPSGRGYSSKSGNKEESDVPNARNKIEEAYFSVHRHWGNRLRLNELKNIIELDGQPLETDTLRTRIALELNHVVTKEEAIEFCTLIAKSNAYNPVRDYLNSCLENATPIDINNLATRWFGTTDELSNTYLKRYLIGAVARIYEPGCQLDTSLILQGKQGLKKSSFFKVLHQGSGVRQPNETWFDDTMSDVSNKDERDKLHRNWCLEWGELERVLRRGDDLVKAFLSTKADTYRPPYGRSPVTRLRQSVIVGTTNRDEFLSDDTGDRRFWVVRVQTQIDIARIEAERNSAWAAAVAAYRAGEQWYLTDEEQAMSSEANSHFHTSDAWEQYIKAFVADREKTTTAEILENCLEFDKAKQDRASQMRVAGILTRLGWKRERISFQGNRVRGWVAPDDAGLPGLPGLPPITEVVHPSNAHTASTSDDAGLPGLPLSQNFPENSETNTNFQQPTSSTPPMKVLLEKVVQVVQEPPETGQNKESEGGLPPVYEVVQVVQVVQALPPSENDLALAEQMLREVDSKTALSQLVSKRGFPSVEGAIAAMPHDAGQKYRQWMGLE